MKNIPATKPLHVSDFGSLGSYIMVPVSQLGDLRALLDQHRVDYIVDENAISLDGAPEVTAVNLGRDVDPTNVQTLLDGAAWNES